MVIRYLSLKTRIGEIWLAASERGLFRLNFGGVDTDVLKSIFRGRREVAFEEGGRIVQVAARELVRYLDARQRKFSVPLDLTGASPFARKVWRVTSKIPYGQVRTYTWVAERIGHGGAPRAVGNALGANPLPIIIPCHRVVRCEGSLGGYGGGLSLKKWLLELEAGQPRLKLE